jgi:HlyD family secretion protein
MRKRTIGIIAAVLIVAGAVIVFGALKNGKNNAVKYRMEALTSGDIEAMVLTSGTLNPVTVVEVGSQVSGQIEKLYVDFNSQVKAGQVIAEIDQSLLKTRVEQNQANYMSAQASLERSKVTTENLKRRYERATSLFEKKLISFEEKDAAESNYLAAKTDVQSAEARLEQAKSQLETSRVDLDYAIIRSPIDGVVISRNINQGQTVAASFQAPKLFEIANDLTKMQVECSVDEADIGRVQEGQKVRFTVDAFPNDNFLGTVRQVRYSPVVTQNVVTYTTIVDVDNPGMKLRPGMTATVSIIVGEARGVLRVPNAALRFTPSLSPEELQKLMKETQERMMAQRKDAGAAPGAGPSADASAPVQRVFQRGDGSGGPGAMMKAGAGGGPGGRARQASRVWILGADGKLSMMFLRTGVTDNSYTEILQSELKEGDEVLIGYESGTAAPRAATTPPMGGPGRGMVFIGR